MKRSIVVVLFIISNILFAQNELHQSLNYQKALENKTREMDGAPGKNYWQNTANYKIKASLDASTRTVNGNETISYFNNSPDTLKQVVIRLYQNIYKKGNVRDFTISTSDITNGVEVKTVKVDGKELKLDGSASAPQLDNTNYTIKLEKPLAPKGKVDLGFAWSFTMPKESNIRMGTYDATSFFVAFWYPQVAVYDDIDGWDTQYYSGQTEMYNDFNNYEVEITMPKNYLVWATGVLQNANEVLNEKVLEKYNQAYKSNEVVKIVSEENYKNGLVTVDKEKLVWNFKAENVPDFIFATSDHYYWDGSMLTVDIKSGRQTFIDAAYKPSSKEFSNVALIARNSIESFSTHMPAVAFPYPKLTVFNGEGGMEFPMMVNDSNVPELQGMVHLTSHEISHTYFPFYMGINERKYAWMDEGWATMLPFDFQTKNAPGYDPRTRNAQSYSDFAGFDTDVPPMIPSHQLRGASYRTASYRRPGAAYEFLRQMLGDELFLKSLHVYMDRWNGKHPTPYDFFNSFNDASSKNLNWYFKLWFFDYAFPDLALKAKYSNDGSLNIMVINKGGIPLPIIVTVTFEDGSIARVIEKTAEVWASGKEEYSENVKPTAKVVKVELGFKQIPDVNNDNNVVKF